MINYWAAFAHSGDPNGAGRPAWPTFRAAPGAAQSLAPGKYGIQPIDLAREHDCGFWSQIDH
jgi:para-nitrobenzyl esterase